MKKKYTVTVAIPAHNEAENIQGLLYSIIKQNQATYRLEKVLVLCDGTTDETITIVNKLTKKYPVIHLLHDGLRRGKIKRLQELYKENTSDIICIFDGDVMLGTKTVLDEMVKDFVDKNVCIVGGNNQPVVAATFVGTLVNTWSHVWYLSRLKYNNGDNIHNIRGCVMALRKSYAKKIRFPEELASESQYIYLFAKKQKVKFIFEKNAIVFYRKPQTVTDYLSQFKRSTPEKQKLQKIFGKKIRSYYPIPKRYSFIALIESCIDHPFLTIASALFTLLMNKLPYETSMIRSGVWKSVESTKKGIPLPFTL